MPKAVDAEQPGEKYPKEKGTAMRIDNTENPPHILILLGT